MSPPESAQSTSTNEESKEFKIPFLSLIPKFALGFLNRGAKVDAVAKEESTAPEGEDSRSHLNPNFATFRQRQPEVEILKLEIEGADQNSNPIVLWEVYALGGFIICKWAWAKWQERQANEKKKKDSTEDQALPKD